VIFGIGVDLVKIERIASSLDKFGNRMAEKVLTEQELIEFHSARWPASFLAKRFAAKEAMAKALGTGFRNHLSLKHIEVVHDDTGKPVIACNNRARELMEETNWDNWGTGRNEKCADCMMHSGYEPTAVADTVNNPLKALQVFIKGPATSGPMVPEPTITYTSAVAEPDADDISTASADKENCAA